MLEDNKNQTEVKMSTLNGDTAETKKSIETRKKLNFYARFVLSLVVFGSFLLLLYLLYYMEF